MTACRHMKVAAWPTKDEITQAVKDLPVRHENWVGRTARGPLGGSFSVRPPAEPDWPVSEHPALR